MLDKDKIKNSLEIDQIYNLISELGGEPFPPKGNILVSRTICHNLAGEGSYKLYYYDNTKLFRCYTDCGEYFDIFELVKKQKTLSTNVEWTLAMSINFVASYFGFSDEDFNLKDFKEKLFDWTILENYDKINKERENKQIINLKIFDSNILNYLPKVRIPSWEEEGISKEIIERNKILYDPVNNGIIIPHYDQNNNLIGIRERTLVEENEKFGKYRPAKLNGKMYNHPLSFNLYNINHSKEIIRLFKKAIIFEGEKSTMQYPSYFGVDNDISVACCGSSLVDYQVKLLLDLGVKELIVAFDKQFKKIGDEEFKRWTKKLTDIHKKYSMFVQISFLFDKWNLLDYKNSPTDKGKKIFLELLNSRIYL